MNWFVNMIFDGGGRQKTLLDKSKSIKSRNKINTLISFLVLGLPFFIELFLALNYHESYYKLVVYNPIQTVKKVLELFSIFVSLYALFITVSSRTIRKISVLFWLLILYVPANFDLICVRITGALLSNDFMFAIFNTHLRETLLIIQEYFAFILISLAIVVCAFCLKPVKRYWNKKYSICAAMLLACSIFGSEWQSFNKIISAFSAHIEDLKDIDRFCKMQTPIEGIKTKSEGKETYVFVIGESVDRKHMGIYGYNRPTTPYFEKIKNELFVFKDVTTAHVFTAAAVKSMLLIQDNSKKIYSLIQFFKSAGFKTFWFSNQGKAHLFDNSIMRFGKSCDEYAFIGGKDVIYSSENYNLTFEDEQRRLKLWDENLLKYFEKALSDSAKKKLIVLHLNGSHYPIDMRYPPDFAKFSLPQKYYDREKALGVCLFDNSILYTDHILSEVIKSLKKSGETSAMLYLSDHGQDINDTEECILTARTWPHGYEVPFVVWVSEKYRKTNAEFINSWDMNLKYVTDKTAYSLIDLARLSHPSVDLSNSIFFSRNHAKPAKDCKE